MNGIVAVCFNFLLLVIVVSFVLVISIVGTRIVAPDWLRENIAEKINASVDDVGFEFGDVSVVIDDGFVPRLWLRDVTIMDDTGHPIARLSDMQSAVALRPLLRGELHPSYVRLTGAQLKLQRANDGAVELAVGDVSEPVESAPDIASLIQQLDEVLLHPGLRELSLIEAQNVTLQYEDARSGETWTMDGGSMALTRDTDNVRLRGDFVLLGNRDYATNLAMNYTGRIGQTASEVGLSFEDMPSRAISSQSPALAWLAAVDAPISGALRASVDETGALGPLNATLRMGEGAIQPTDDTLPVTFESAQVYFTYHPQEQRISVSEVAVNSKWLDAVGEGQATLIDVQDGWPSSIDVQFDVNSLLASPAELYDQPVALDAAKLDMRLQLDPFAISLREFSIVDQEETFTLAGEARVEAEGWDLIVDGHMDQMDPDRLIELWPKKLAHKARNWVVDNIRTIDISNIEVSVRSLPTHKPDFSMAFAFSDFNSQFIREFPIVESGYGRATLVDYRFSVEGHGGHISPPQGGKVDIAGTVFEIPDVRAKPTPAKVHLKTESTITAALSLLNQAPLSLIDKTELPVTLADGRVALDGVIDVNLSKPVETDNVAFNVTGRLDNVRSEVLVKNRVLSAKTLQLKTTQEVLTLSGDGTIGEVPFSGTFETFLGPDNKGSNAKGKIELSSRFLNEFKIGLPPGTVSGEGSADVEIDFQKGERPEFRAVSDLEGLGLRIPQIGWTLPRATKGVLEFSGRFGEPAVIDRVLIDAAGLRASGNVSLRANGQLDRASFTQVKVGRWIDAPLEFVGRGAGKAPQIRVLGGVLDLRETSIASARSPGEEGARNSGPIEAVLDRLQISDSIALTDFRADMITRNGLDGAFTGRVNGGAPIQGQIVPKGGRSAFRLQSDNAAAVLASAGLLQQARNGKLDVSLLPGEKPGVYEGYLRATGNIRIKEAPTMAAVLNAVSIVGLLEQMGGDGIHFEEVEARFQLSPDRVTLYSGSAIGASMGISMDGYYFPETKQVDMQGVVSPLYVLNSVGALFTRRGEGLFGFNYSIKGPTDDLKVKVNPLTAFTPAMFRNLFRRSPPQPNVATRDSSGVNGVPSDELQSEGPQQSSGVTGSTIDYGDASSDR